MRETKFLNLQERLQMATKAAAFLVAGWLINSFADFDGKEIFALASYGIGALGLIFAVIGIQRM